MTVLPYSAFSNLSSTMEAECVSFGFKRELMWIEEGCEISERYNLRKRMKAGADSSMKNWTKTAPVRATVIEYFFAPSSFNLSK